jgi:alpha-amylase
MCNNNSRWWMGGLEGAGYIADDPLKAVTFVDNPDTDLSYGENVIWNKMLGYALILTAEGYPSVYYKDYSTDAGCYGLKPLIDNLIWIHENLAFGTTSTRWGNDLQVYVFERQGFPGLLVALNNDQSNSYQRTVQTSFGPNTQLHEYTGKHSDIWTNSQGEATFTVPRNINGQSYLCFSRTGYAQPFSLRQMTTAQTFFGAADLDASPAVNGSVAQPSRIWCRQGAAIEAELKPDTTGWSAASKIVLEVADDHGAVLKSAQSTAGSKDARVSVDANKSGWFTLRLTGVGLPSTGAAYELTVRYTGTQELTI